MNNSKIANIEVLLHLELINNNIIKYENLLKNKKELKVLVNEYNIDAFNKNIIQFNDSISPIIESLCNNAGIGDSLKSLILSNSILPLFYDINSFTNECGEKLVSLKKMVTMLTKDFIQI